LPGSARGLGKRARSNPGTAPQADAASVRGHPAPAAGPDSRVASLIGRVRARSQGRGAANVRGAQYGARAAIRLTLYDRRFPGSRTRLGHEQVTVLRQVRPCRALLPPLPRPMFVRKAAERYEDAGSGGQLRAEIPVEDTARVSGRERARRERKTRLRSSRRLPSRSGSASEGRAGCGRTGSRSCLATRY
jgi:hypothetical protein